MFSSSITSCDSICEYEGDGQRAYPLSNHLCPFFSSPENKEAKQPWQEVPWEAPPVWRLPRTVRLKTQLSSLPPTASSAKRGGTKEGRGGSLIVRSHSNVEICPLSLSTLEQTPRERLSCVCVSSLRREASENHFALWGVGDTLALRRQFIRHNVIVLK